jgi:microcompartment protein CcmK/EutM
MIVQPLNEDLVASGEPEISADALNCCEGEIVWVEGGKEASYALPTKYGPSDSSIVAKIDSLDVAVKLARGESARLPFSSPLPTALASARRAAGAGGAA